MKALAFFSLSVLVLCAQVRAESIFVPSLDGDWSSSGTGKAADKSWAVDSGTTTETTPLAVEVAPGSYYLFRIHKDDKTKTTSTRVYHSATPDDFGLKSPYPEAMHMVADFPVAISKVNKQGDAWSLEADLPGKGASTASLRWQEIKDPVPAPSLEATKGKIRVALYEDSGSAGKGIPKCSEQLGSVGDMEITKLNGDGIRAGLSGYNVVIFTGGSGSRQASTIGLAGREQVRRFVAAGGGYVGICAGAYLACDGFSWSVHVLDAKTPSSLWERGHADLEIEAMPSGQSLLGLPAKTKVIYHNGPILTPGNNPAIPDYEPLVLFRTEVSKTAKHAGLQLNTPAIARGAFGLGKVLVSSPHPEQTAGMEEWIVKAVRAVAN